MYCSSINTPITNNSLKYIPIIEVTNNFTKLKYFLIAQSYSMSIIAECMNSQSLYTGKGTNLHLGGFRLAKNLVLVP